MKVVEDMKYIYGPVPSRRMGISLGVSPIPGKTCNYSCIYCQLGRTNQLTNTRQPFFQLEHILHELDETMKEGISFDVITVVGEGEPTLYLHLGKLLKGIKKRTDKPVALITNGALFYDAVVRKEAKNADIVLPSFDAYDEESFHKINRPHGALTFEKVYQGLKTFGEDFSGQLWMEIMLMNGVNDDEASISIYKSLLNTLRYDRLYLNTPVRPPAETHVEAVSNEAMQHAVKQLNGISIDLLESGGFHSDIKDHYKAILSIIKRHPMNQHELESFLVSRNYSDVWVMIDQLKRDHRVQMAHYKGYDTFRIKE